MLIIILKELQKQMHSNFTNKAQQFRIFFLRDGILVNGKTNLIRTKYDKKNSRGFFM